MRVGRDRGGRGERLRAVAGDARTAGTRAGAFQDELRMRELEREAEIEQALLGVDAAARRLRDEGDLAALHKYKLALRTAFGHATRLAYKVHAESGFGPGGRHKLLYIVRTVDQKLAELAELLVQKERDNVAIAARLDEIRGLLLDLYR